MTQANSPAIARDNVAGYDPRFKTPAGWLTPYALACGYNEIYDEHGHCVTMYRDGCLHVRHHHSARPCDSGPSIGRVVWDCPRTLTEARKQFARIRRSIKTLTPDDKRYTITLEHTGAPAAQFVLRFCGEALNYHATRLEAFNAYLEARAARNKILAGAAA